MKTFRCIYLIILLVIISNCERSENDMGKLLFYTNSSLLNCPFEIEISINNVIIGTLTAASTYKDEDCVCYNPTSIGILIDLPLGTHNYSARELSCTATNRVNNWTGTLTVKKDSCTLIFLDVLI